MQTSATTPIRGTLHMSGYDLRAATERVRLMGCILLGSVADKDGCVLSVELPSRAAIDAVTCAALFDGISYRTAS